MSNRTVWVVGGSSGIEASLAADVTDRAGLDGAAEQVRATLGSIDMVCKASSVRRSRSSSHCRWLC